MAIVLKSQRPEYVTVEPGEYTTFLDAVTQSAGKYGPMLRFQFRIAEGEPHEGIPVSLVCTAFLTPGNRLDKILQALGSSALDIGEEVDVEKLRGLYVKAYVENSKDGEVTYNNVSKVRKLRDNEMPKNPPKLSEKKEETHAQTATTTAPAATATVPAATNLTKEDVPF